MDTAVSEIISTTASAQQLIDKLDDLWIRYLDCLEQYEQAQAAIGQLLSSGFFSLTRANAYAPSGRRYGQDWYDDRAKATTRIVAFEATTESDNWWHRRLPSASHGLQLDIYDGHPSCAQLDADTTPKVPHPTQQPSPPSTPRRETQSRDTKSPGLKDNITAGANDPLRWFGILTPPELRKAQVLFSAAMARPTQVKPATGEASHTSQRDYCGPLILAVNAARQMRTTEIDIRKIRKALRKSEKSTAAQDT